jgi:hypothetical protein
VHALASIEECQRSIDRATRNRKAIQWPQLNCTGTMNPMAALAGDGGLIAEVFPNQMPGALRIHWQNQVTNRSIEVHAVTAETILHEMLFRVLRVVHENVAVCGAVRARMPSCVFLLMALLAIFCHANDIHIAQSDFFWPAMGEMHANVAQLGGEGCGVTVLTADVAVI